MTSVKGISVFLESDFLVFYLTLILRQSDKLRGTYLYTLTRNMHS